MRVSELLRKLADVVDQRDEQQSSTGPAMSPVEVDHEDHTDQTVMVTPLQQKQELLKKVAGVDSFYDDEPGEEACDTCGHSPCECEGSSEDELSIMKRNAGMPMAVMQIAGEENDIV